jgi:glycosyltransferase involved in cell wall biosynthesis
MMIKVLFLTKYASQAASSRMRSYQYLEYFEDNEISCDVRPLISDDALMAKYESGKYSYIGLFRRYWARIGVLIARRQYDLIWIEKEALPWMPLWIERYLLSGVPYVLDYDDAIFHNYDRHRSLLVRKVFGRRLDGLMSGARLVVGGNEYLAQRARDAGAEWVEVLPTVVDLRRYVLKPAESVQGTKKIVWIGSPSTARYLQEIAEPLAKLSKSTPFALRVIGADIAMKGVDLECLPWSEKSEAMSIAECDIGVMPLSDSPWERGKCGYKLIQYMACGLPVVASPVGANLDLVQPSVNGWLANTPGEWLERLRHLLTDPTARAQMGQTGRARVEAKYSVQRTAPQLTQLLKAAARGAVA